MGGGGRKGGPKKRKGRRRGGRRRTRANRMGERTKRENKGRGILIVEAIMGLVSNMVSGKFPGNHKDDPS